MNFTLMTTEMLSQNASKVYQFQVVTEIFFSGIATALCIQ